MVQPNLQLLERVEEILSSHQIGNEVISPAAEWIDAGFDDAEEISDWLMAKCFKADGARRMENAGITPEQAALTTIAGGSEVDTIGFRIAKDTLSLDEARRIITHQFWNS